MDKKIFYKLRESIVVHKQNENIILWDSKQGWELKVSSSLMEIIRLFSFPITKDLAFDEIKVNKNIKYPFFSKIVDDLIKETVIEEFIAAEKNNNFEGKGGMFNTPLIGIDECLRGNWCDVVFLGMPYDLNVTYKPGSRFAPSYLRRVSKSLYQYDGKFHEGIYDPTDNKQKLVGIRMADCGDINSIVFTKNGYHFDALKELIGRIHSKEIFPVTIGGDHSISLPCIEGMAEMKEKIGVIQLDAHADFGLNEIGNWRETIHHGNFMDKVIANDYVEHIIQIGIRQLTSSKLTHEKIDQWTGKKVLSNFEDLKSKLRNDIPYYLTIDVDVFDPTVIEATGTPLPRGFSYEEILKVVTVLTENIKIIGLDIVELLPGTSEKDGIITSDLIFQIISKVWEKKIAYSTENSKDFIT